MAKYITIDTGTTNTRICLVENGRITDCVRYGVGAKNSLSNSLVLKKTIKEGIEKLLENNAYSEKDIDRILASGMITSELGLVLLPHIPAPAGIKELKRNVYDTVLKDISHIPFSFVSGVKLNGSSLEDTDLMRGEETEFAYIFEGEGIYVLPGSHTKIITADEFGRITCFKTMLSGEMISALAENTILKDAVDLNCENVDNKFLLKGYEYTKIFGLNEALFKVRILKNVFCHSATELYSFFMGAVLCRDIEYILSLKAEKIVVGGKAQIKNAICELLKISGADLVVSLSDETVLSAVPLGLVKIYEYEN